MEYDVQAIKVSENSMHACQDKYESKAVTRALIRRYPYIRVLHLKLTLNVFKEVGRAEHEDMNIHTPSPQIKALVILPCTRAPN